MTQPADLSQLVFHVHKLPAVGIAPEMFLVMVVGNASDGVASFWADPWSWYDSNSDPRREDIQQVLDEMCGRATPFMETSEFIRDEWIEQDGGWCRGDRVGAL